MSPRARHSATARHHVEWLQLVDVSGPFLSLSVLVETFPQGLDADDPEVAERLRQAFSEWQANEELRRPDPTIHREFLRLVLREVLEYEGVLAEDAEIADLKATLPEHRVTLRPDLAVRRSGVPPAVLVATYKAGTALERALDERGFHASPAERMRLLLRGTGVKSGLVTNGDEWMLVHAPAERTSTFVTWQTQLLLEERVTLRAFQSLLGARRLFGVPEPETLDGLFERSRDDEREVTDQLGRQVRRAIELLVSAFDRADREAGGKLLRELPEYRLYEASVAVAMRVIFLLAAEARGLLPDEGPWVESYAVTPLRAELQEVADRSGPELLDRRFDAWPRLLATFRAVHGGVEHSRVRLPGYGGGLFDASRYPFLESVDGRPLRISNRVILHILDAIQTLEVDVPGGRERRPLSFRALGVEQIGHVYEGLLDHTAIRADAPAVGLVGTTKKEPELALSELERKRHEGEDALLDLLEEETGRGVPALRKALAAEPDPGRAGRLRAACEGDDELVAGIVPFLGLVRDDPYGLPMVFREGAVYVTTSPGRRATGTHYTPPSLTEPIVRYALEPVVYTGPAEGLAPEQWTLKRPHELLELKVCDIAMGSAAFLVAACRYLAARLVEAWEQHPDEMPPDAGADPEERDLTARRLVAERCLYGVDKNPLAVEIAKVSMWLTTMRKDRPFTFLDHALRHGDSLLGITSVDQLERLTLNPEEAESVLLEPAREAIRATLDEVRAVRERIEATDAVDIREVEEKAASLALAEERTAALRTVGDLNVGAALEDAAGKANATTIVEAAADEICAALLADSDAERDALITRIEARAGDAMMVGRALGDPDPPKPFHWVLEFPEVFERERSGFDAIISNPPYMGNKYWKDRLGNWIQPYFAQVLGRRLGKPDVIVLFVWRMAGLLREGGVAASLATQSITEVDSRRLMEVAVLSSHTIIRADRSKPWPGEASVVVSVLWITEGAWVGKIVLDEMPVDRIGADLRPASYQDVKRLAATLFAFEGVHNAKGLAFVVPRDHYLTKHAQLFKPYVSGRDLTEGNPLKPERAVLDLTGWSEAALGELPEDVQQFLREVVRPTRGEAELQPYKGLRERWWTFWNTREDGFAITRLEDNCIVVPVVAKYLIALRAPSAWVYTNKVVVLDVVRPDVQTLLLSPGFDVWVDAHGGSLGETRVMKIASVLGTFPLPGDYADHRLSEQWQRQMLQTISSFGGGMTHVLNLVHDPDNSHELVVRLRSCYEELHRNVAVAYGWDNVSVEHGYHDTPWGIRYTVNPSTREALLDRLHLLNHERYAEEVRRGLHAKGRLKGKRRPAAIASAGPATLFQDD